MKTNWHMRQLLNVDLRSNEEVFLEETQNGKKTYPGKRRTQRTNSAADQFNSLPEGLKSITN